MFFEFDMLKILKCKDSIIFENSEQKYFVYIPLIYLKVKDVL